MAPVIASMISTSGSRDDGLAEIVDFGATKLFAAFGLPLVRRLDRRDGIV